MENIESFISIHVITPCAQPSDSYWDSEDPAQVLKV